MRISVFGNCQAAPIRSLLAQHLRIETPDCPLNYAVTAADANTVLPDFGASDLIFAQRVSDDFGVEWARTSFLRAEFPGRVIVWPSIYFDGYYPDVEYLYRGHHGKIVGPLSDYHFRTIITSFTQGLSAREAANLMLSNHIFAAYPEPVIQSLAALRNREAECDVAISDYIEANFTKSVLQFTPNHPCSHLLAEVTMRLCRKAGINAQITEPYGIGELNYVYIPPYPAISDRYGLRFLNRSIFGVSVGVAGTGVTLGNSMQYTVESLVECYYSIYRSVF